MALVLAATGLLHLPARRQHAARRPSTRLCAARRARRPPGPSTGTGRRPGRGRRAVARTGPRRPRDGALASTSAGLPPLAFAGRLERVLAGSGAFGAASPTRLATGAILAVPGHLGDTPVPSWSPARSTPREETLDRLARELLLGRPACARCSRRWPGTGSRPRRFARSRPCGVAPRRSAAAPGSRLPFPSSRDELSRLAETLNDMLARLEAASSTSGGSSTTRATSCGLRSRCSAPSSSSRYGIHGRRRARAGDALGGRGDRAAQPARRGSAALRALRPGTAAAPPRAASTRGTCSPTSPTGTRRAARSAGRSAEPARLDRSSGRRRQPRLEQALGNLVENALAYGAGAVVLSARARAGDVELHVIGRGAGYSRRPSSPRAFDRFSRADEARGRGGTGLGLAIVDLIAEAHGGEAGIANRPSEAGADAWISLACQRA